MSYSSLGFMICVLVALFIYCLLRTREARIDLLALIGLIWYASWTIYWPLLLVFCVAINYFFLRWKKFNPAAGTAFFLGLLLFDIGFLVGLKLLPLISVWSTPYGTSFFMFMLIGAVIDIWRGGLKEPPAGLVEFVLFVSFFPVLIAGPIERYHNLGSQIHQLKQPSRNDIFSGLLIFGYGWAKKYYVADLLAEPIANLIGFGRGNAIDLIFCGFLSTCQAYVEFSSFCDMGRGVARLFGISVLPNFRPFYYSKDPNDFWKRWNITLGSWIRDYLTLPALLKFGRLVNRYLILLVAFLVVGLWHGFAWHWFFFGLFNGVLIVAFSFLQNTHGRKHPLLIARIGFGLAALLICGNGILQSDRSLGVLRDFFTAPLWFSHSLFAWSDVFAFAGNHIINIFILLLILAVDYGQEANNDLDFFLKKSLSWRLCGALMLCFLVGYAMHGKLTFWLRGTPPLYFTF